MLKKWILLLLATAFTLSACHSAVYNQTQGNIADVKLRQKAAIAKSDASGRVPPSLLMRQGLYVDTTPRSLSHEPDWMSNHIVINGDSLPFSYFSRVIANGVGQNILTKFQVGLDPTVKISMNYSGSIKGALDLLATKAGYVYAIRGGKTIYWQAFVSRTYDVAFMPGGTDYLMGKAGSSGGGGGGGGQVANYLTGDPSASEFSTLKGSLSVWTDLETTIKQLLSKEGQVVVSQSTTSVTVNDRPTNVELVGQYIANLNKSLSKQVLIKVQILEVNLENSYEFGINWNLVISAFHSSPFVLNANYGTPVSITQLAPFAGTVPIFGTDASKNPVQPPPIPSYTVLFNALNQQGKTSLVTEPRVVCMNNQVCEMQITSQKGYAASVQNTTLAAGGTAPTSTVTSQITPGTIITGLTLFLLPKIANDKIVMQVNADLTVDDGFKEFTSGEGQGASKIQLPNITQKHFNQRSIIRSGDTLILSGFRQLANLANANQFITSQALGGKGSIQRSVETIILITPIVLNGCA